MELAELQQLAQEERERRKPIGLRCCTAAGCMSMGGEAVRAALEHAIQERGLAERMQAQSVGCLRLCCNGPLVQADPSGELFEQVRPEDAGALLDALDGKETQLRRGDVRQPFFTRQMAIVLENSGLVEPERIESYLALGGYQALHHVVNEMSPAQVVEAVTRSGLRGRGGAGYPTGVKWGLVQKMPGPQKYIVCNADEGDPGAFMDRSVLESDPHRVLEGMAIAAYAVGAAEGYIYVRGEYPLAIHRLQIAIKQARGLGVLGTKIFDTPFNLRLDLRIGAGAFVCGEETALISSIEGQRGSPHVRPPYPAEKGLWDCPTLINNVETYANVAPIITRGADWFASIGTAKSKGTKVFALAGKIKAVQTGGPSGGCIPADLLDTPVDYESLQQLGSIMGSGGMIVMDETTNMIEVARYFMEFCVDESCGKCVPCRVGTVQMHRLLSRIADGRATADDVAKLEALCDMVKHTSLCGLGQSAPNPVLSTLRYFRGEYEGRLRTEQPRRLPLPLFT